MKILTSGEPGTIRGGASATRSHASEQGKAHRKSGGSPAAQARASLSQQTETSQQSFGQLVSGFARAGKATPPVAPTNPSVDPASTGSV